MDEKGNCLVYIAHSLQSLHQSLRLRYSDLQGITHVLRKRAVYVVFTLLCLYLGAAILRVIFIELCRRVRVKFPKS